MSFEFFTAMGLKGTEEDLENAVKSEDRFSPLADAPWTLKARLLSTGLAKNDDFVSTLKNGKEGKKHQKKVLGYPHIVENHVNPGIEPPWKDVFAPDPSLIEMLPKGSCLFAFDLVLEAPFFSRDDTAFYPIENPLKREWVFQVPYLNASGMKGLIRWAYRMCWGNGTAGAANTVDREEIYLFGQRKEDKADASASQGALFCYPLFWEGRVGFEVINPHDRESGTGKKPIKYEVVLPGGKATLYLILVNRTASGHNPEEAVAKLEPALEWLLTGSGLSAKRSAGWGSVRVSGCRAWTLTPDGQIRDENSSAGTPGIGANNWENLVDADGNLKPVEPNYGFNTKRIASLTGISATRVKKNRDAAVEKVKDLWEEHLQMKQDIAAGKEVPWQLAEISKPGVSKLMKTVTDNLKALANTG